MGESEYIKQEIEKECNWELALGICSNIGVVHRKILEKIARKINNIDQKNYISLNGTGFLIIPNGWDNYDINLNGHWWLHSKSNNGNGLFFDKISEKLSVAKNQGSDWCNLNVLYETKNQDVWNYMLSDEFVPKMHKELNAIVSAANAVALDYNIKL